MYTVLIAEDELLVRIGLTASVMWEKLDMQVVADVADGEKAYELFCEKKPDILITDLSMPGMDGLTLIRKIRQTQEKCAVIVVTCMDRFDLLHEAMDLGVIAYLVKVTMSMTDIENALLKAKQALGAPRRRESLQGAERVEAAFSDYLFGNTLPYEQLAQRCLQEGMELLPGYYLCIARIQSQQKISWQLEKAFRGMLMERLKNQHVLLTVQQGGYTVALFSRTPKVHDMISQCEAFVEYIRDSFGVHVLMAATMENISAPCLPERFAKIRSTCDVIRDNPSTLLWFDENGALVDTHIRAELEHLRESLWLLSDYELALELVKTAYELEDAFSGNAELFFSLLERLAMRLWEKSGVSQEQRMMLRRGLEDADTPISALQYLCRYGVDRLPTYRSEIRMVISFVIRHPEADLSLKRAAQLVSLHPQYLSNLFKKEVGVNYSDFICTTRVLAAKRILRTSSQSVQQIAETLGFSDQAYFCRKFKQLTGQTPVQWRRRIQ